MLKLRNENRLYYFAVTRYILTNNGYVLHKQQILEKFL